MSWCLSSRAVEYKDGNSKPRFKKEVKTNEHAEFKIQLPFKVRKHVKRIKGCTFKLISTAVLWPQLLCYLFFNETQDKKARRNSQLDCSHSSLLKSKTFVTKNKVFQTPKHMVI
ncbi:hypothetical protein E2542_SST13612 [Spatholobus suberectus]|nr:hypothetical protein E2542_SST13612 [Spatholobus suberectus]